MIPNSIWKFAQRIDNFYGGKAYLCGGWVRDHVMGIENKDYDIEVHGVTVENLKDFIGRYYNSSVVGESFVVWKVYLYDDDKKKIAVDVSIPRLEKKTGNKHTDFEVTGDPFLSIEEACRRRDCTINSMLFDILDSKLIDPYGGQLDIRGRVLRAVDPKTFIEDPLRVLRIMQFAARFNFKVDEETVKLCNSIDLSDLPAERLWAEFEKWFFSKHPSVGMEYFVKLGIYKLFDPISTEFINEDQVQRAAYTVGKAMYSSASSCENANVVGGYRQALFLCFLSDLFSSVAGLEKFLDKLKVFTVSGYNVRKKVIEIVMNPSIPVTDSEIRRESTKKDLALFFDFKIHQMMAMSRYSLANSIVDLELMARKLDCYNNPLQPLLMGRHILELGVPAGKKVGDIFNAVFELQIQGKVSTLEEALEEARKLI